LLDVIKGQRIIDFGCADGDQTFAMADAGAAEVLGIEIVDSRIERARVRQSVAPRSGVSFAKALGPEHAGKYDLAISLNSFEHFAEPLAILRQIFDTLRPGGRLLLSFGPLWWSAYGPHQAEFTLSPWPHVFFGERTFMSVRGALMNEPEKKTYADRWLNRMSVAKYEQTIAGSGFRVAHCDYVTSRGLRFLAYLPGLREVAINRIVATLQRPG
jgi:SAM-dependent methyltransferase